jgi:hypothetical protein
MRFQILWLDSEGFADFAEYIEAQSFEKALRFAARRMIRTEMSVKSAGYLIAHADSEFLRRYMRAGGPIQTRAERFDKEEMREQFPHLFK